MSYLNSWHRNYAAESIKRRERNNWSVDPDYDWTIYAVECGEIATLARQVGQDIGSDLVCGIAQTVSDTIAGSARGSRPGARFYRRITDKQRKVLAEALLERFGSARVIAEVVWGLTDDEIDNADV